MNYDSIAYLEELLGREISPGELPQLISFASTQKEDGENIEDTLKRLVENEKNSNNLAVNFNPVHDKDGKFGGSGSGSYDHLSPYSFEEKITKEYGSQASFTKSDKAAIDKYVKTNAFNTNRYLVHPKDELIDSKSESKNVKALDKAMKNSLNRDTTLYRGFATSSYLKVGSVIKYKGYSSTSFNSNIAKEFAIHHTQTNNKRPVVLNIKAKKGQKGIIPVLTSSESIDTTLRSNEQEFILPRDTKFKITKVNDLGTHEEAEVTIQ